MEPGQELWEKHPDWRIQPKFQTCVRGSMCAQQRGPDGGGDASRGREKQPDTDTSVQLHDLFPARSSFSAKRTALRGINLKEKWVKESWKFFIENTSGLELAEVFVNLQRILRGNRPWSEPSSWYRLAEFGPRAQRASGLRPPSLLLGKGSSSLWTTLELSLQPDPLMLAPAPLSCPGTPLLLQEASVRGSIMGHLSLCPPSRIQHAESPDLLHSCPMGCGGTVSGCSGPSHSHPWQAS